MKITAESITKDQLKRLQNQQRHKVIAQQASLKNLEKKFAEQEKIVRNEGRRRVNSVKADNDNDMLRIQMENKRALTKMRKQHEMEEFQLGNEHRQLIEHAKLQNEDLNINLKENFLTKLDEVSHINGDLNIKTNAQVKKMNELAEDQLQSEKFATSIKIQQREREIQGKLDKEEQRFNSMIDKQRSDFVEKLQQNRQDQKRILAATERKSRILLTNKKQTQQHQLKFMNNAYQNKLLQEKESFQIKYQKQVQTHQQILKRLKHKFEQELSRFTQQSSKDQKGKIDKEGDPFYNMSLLTPKISESKKHITLSLNIPQYEADKVQIKVQGHEVVLNLSRRYEDQLHATDGSFNRSKRSEIISKKLQFPVRLSSKNISRNYKDNVFTIQINKDA